MTDDDLSGLLQIAVIENDERAVIDLMQFGANPGYCIPGYFGGKSAIHIAAEQGQEALLGVMLDAYATSVDVVVKSSTKRTALQLAAENNFPAIVKLLVTHEADLNYHGLCKETALHIAAKEGHEAVLHILLNAGADYEARGPNGNTALHDAAAQGHYSIVKLLLNVGATVDSINRRCKTPLQYSAWNGHVEVTQILLGAGADANLSVRQPNTMSGPDDEVPYWRRIQDIGDTPLHIAANNGHVKMVRLLLDNSADPRAQNEREETALHSAIRWKKLVVVSQLLSETPDLIDAKNWEDRTPLHLAVINQSIDISKYLLDQGANVNTLGSNGRTSLHLAVSSNNEKLVTLLLEKGADYNIVSRDGETPVDLALISKRASLLRHFTDHRCKDGRFDRYIMEQKRQ